MPKGDTMTRLQSYEDAGRTPPFPQIEAGEYLLAAMKELGAITSNGFGIAPQSWSEIRAFCGDAYEWWEINALRAMCVAYTNGLKTGQDAMSIAPMERKKVIS